MNYYNLYLEKYKEGLLGFNAMGILFQSCLGGAATMLILMNGTSFVQMTQLFFVVVLCMGYNGVVISQQTPKTIYNVLLASVFNSLFICLINIWAI
jgi:hypothetical protein